jgi:hypothetical protein
MAGKICASFMKAIEPSPPHGPLVFSPSTTFLCLVPDLSPWFRGIYQADVSTFEILPPTWLETIMSTGISLLTSSTGL